MEQVNKIPVKKITLLWAEGLIAYCDKFPLEFNSFASANAFLKANSHQFPKTGGYDKHKFNVVWHDNDTEGYTGRLDCKHWSCTDNDLNISAHIREFCEWLVENDANQAAQARDFLENYQLS